MTDDYNRTKLIVNHTDSIYSKPDLKREWRYQLHVRELTGLLRAWAERDTVTMAVNGYRRIESAFLNK